MNRTLTTTTITSLSSTMMRTGFIVVSVTPKLRFILDLAIVGVDNFVSVCNNLAFSCGCCAWCEPYVELQVMSSFNLMRSCNELLWSCQMQSLVSYILHLCNWYEDCGKFLRFLEKTRWMSSEYWQAPLGKQGDKHSDTVVIATYFIMI